jgi:hypothetical protein
MSWDPDAELDPSAPGFRATGSELATLRRWVASSGLHHGRSARALEGALHGPSARALLEDGGASEAAALFDARGRGGVASVGALAVVAIVSGIAAVLGPPGHARWLAIGGAGTAMLGAAWSYLRHRRARTWAAAWCTFADRHRARTSHRALTALRWFREFWANDPAASWLALASRRAVFSFASPRGWPCLVVAEAGRRTARLYVAATPGAFGSRDALELARAGVGDLGLELVALPGGVVVGATRRRSRRRGLRAERDAIDPSAFDRAIAVIDRGL